MAQLDLPTNQIQEFAKLLSRKRWAVILPALAGLAIGTTVLGFVPKRYESWTRVEVREVRLEEDYQARNPSQNPLKNNLETVSAQILATPRIDKALAERLKWQDYLAVRLYPEKAQEYRDLVRERTVVERFKKTKEQGSDFITIKYRDEDPQRAADFANSLREVWTGETLQAFRELIAGEQKQAREQLDNASSRLNSARQLVRTWQEQHGLSPTQPIGGRVTVEEDWVVQLYRKLEQDAQTLTGEVAAAKDKYELANQRWAAEPRVVEEPLDGPGGPSGDPNVATFTQIANLKKEILDLKSGLKGIKPFHPKYQIDHQQIELREKEIKDLEASLVRLPDGNLDTKPATREVLSLKKLALKEEAARAESEYNVLQSKLDTTRKQLDEHRDEYRKRAEVYQRYSALRTDEKVAEKEYEDAQVLLQRKTNLLQQISGAESNPYRVFDEAVPAEESKEPNVPLFLALALVAGAGAGLLWVFLREFLRPSFRNVEDAVGTLPVPVLGFVDRIVTRREVRRQRVRKFVGITSTLAVILLVGGLGSLYLLQPKALPKPIRTTLDAVKQSLR